MLHCIHCTFHITVGRHNNMFCNFLFPLQIYTYVYSTAKQWQIAQHTYVPYVCTQMEKPPMQKGHSLLYLRDVWEHVCTVLVSVWMLSCSEGPFSLPPSLYFCFGGICVYSSTKHTKHHYQHMRTHVCTESRESFECVLWKRGSMREGHVGVWKNRVVVCKDRHVWLNVLCIRTLYASVVSSSRLGYATAVG